MGGKLGENEGWEGSRGRMREGREVGENEGCRGRMRDGTEVAWGE